MITPAYSLTAVERVLPKLFLDFTTGVLDSRVTVTRALDTATRVNSSGLIETVNADLPRFDYSFTNVGTPLGLLIEESRTNLLTYSNDLRSTSEAGSTRAWAQAFGALTVTANDGIGPDGQNSASKFSFTASDYAGRKQSVTLAASTPYTFSIWVKRISGSGSGWIEIIGSGVIGSAFAAFTATSDWTRVSVSGTTTGAGTAEVYIYPEYDTNRTGEYLFWGAQLETGSFATSNILTTTTSVTRNADVVTMTGTNFSDWYNATEGTFIGVYQNTSNDLNALLSCSDGTTGNYMQLAEASASVLRLLVLTSSSIQVNSIVATSSGNVPCGFTYKENSFNLAANATLGTRDTVATVPTVDRMDIGFLRQTGGYTNGTISSIRYYPLQLTDAEIRAFTK